MDVRFGFVVSLATATLVCSGGVRAQDPAAVHNSAAAETSHEWEFSASVFTFAPAHDTAYASPILTADRDWLHLEARYNYEAIDTGSVFVGYNLDAGNDELSFTATPILGGVFGDTTGIAPGAEVALGYSRFELYAEAEYVFDTRDSSDDFFYMWSELTYSPADWMRFGLAAQRTRAYHTDLDVQRGLLLGFKTKHVDFTAYLFNVGWDDALLVFSVGFSA